MHEACVYWHHGINLHESEFHNLFYIELLSLLPQHHRLAEHRSHCDTTNQRHGLETMILEMCEYKKNGTFPAFSISSITSGADDHSNTTQS